MDDIVVGFGNALYQKDLDRYVAGEDVPFEALTHINLGSLRCKAR